MKISVKDTEMKTILLMHETTTWSTCLAHVHMSQPIQSEQTQIQK